MSGMWTAAFWRAVAERAIRTFAQTLVAAPITGAVMALVTAGSGQELKIVLVNSCIATLLSVAMSIGVAKFGPAGPSLGPEELVVQPPPTDLLPAVSPDAPASRVWRPDGDVTGGG